MAEDIILDFSKNSDMAVMILRFVFYTFPAFQIVCLSIAYSIFPLLLKLYIILDT
jgi:hypothetical protein